MSSKLEPVDLAKVQRYDVLFFRDDSSPFFVDGNLTFRQEEGLEHKYHLARNGFYRQNGRVHPDFLDKKDIVKILRAGRFIMREPRLKAWMSVACVALDDLEKLFRQLNNKADDECESYSQQEYLLQELEHLRDAVSETTEDDLEVE